MTGSPPRLVLASSSRYRKALLDRLGLPYASVSPDIDESALPGEIPDVTVRRLALSKAQRVAADFPEALIIGSDQVAVLEGRVLGKPGNHDAAAAQLQAMSGSETLFHTALVLFDAASGRSDSAVVPTKVRMRTLSAAQIERYLRRDEPYDCAGSAKIEALGITLVESVHSSDPTALIGLPLIALTGMLQRAGIELP